MSTDEMLSIVTEKLDAWLTAVVAKLPSFGLAVLVLVLFEGGATLAEMLEGRQAGGGGKGFEGRPAG